MSATGEPTVTVNGERRPHDGGTIETLLKSLGHEPGRPGIAVAVNDEIVARHEWETRALRAGDRVEIVGAVQGG